MRKSSTFIIRGSTQLDEVESCRCSTESNLAVKLHPPPLSNEELYNWSSMWLNPYFESSGRKFLWCFLAGLRNRSVALP
eukprot:gene22988-biopygen8357